MAKIFTVTEARELEGSTLAGISGTLTELYKRTSGTHAEHGDWSLQNGTLKGEDGVTIKIVFDKREEVPMSWKGQRITCLSTKSDKGINGVKVKMSKARTDKKGKSYPSELFVNITAVADAFAGIGSAEGAPPAENPKPAVTRPAEEPAQAPAAPSKPATSQPVKNTDGLKVVDRRAMQLANLSIRAWAATKYVSIHQGLTDAQAQATYGTIFISLEREKHQDKMPMHPMESKKAEPVKE